MNKSFKYVRSFRNNLPDQFLIFAGVRTFGADPIAVCEEEQNAVWIVNALNFHAEESGS